MPSGRARSVQRVQGVQAGSDRPGRARSDQLVQLDRARSDQPVRAGSPEHERARAPRAGARSCTTDLRGRAERHAARPDRTPSESWAARSTRRTSPDAEPRGPQPVAPRPGPAHRSHTEQPRDAPSRPRRPSRIDAVPAATRGLSAGALGRHGARRRCRGRSRQPFARRRLPHAARFGARAPAWRSWREPLEGGGRRPVRRHARRSSRHRSLRPSAADRIAGPLPPAGNDPVRIAAAESHAAATSRAASSLAAAPMASRISRCSRSISRARSERRGGAHRSRPSRRLDGWRRLWHLGRGLWPPRSASAVVCSPARPRR